ncbi:hypothetical protein H0H92_001250 [Tricholoma furcatifolium]|nr:hypothetical protein H0H92_001250 [Tricholoma furcatifolium]
MPPPTSTKKHKPHVPKPPDASSEVISAIVGLIAISLVSFVYQRTLIPLYATGPTTYLLNPILAGTVLLAASNPISVSTSRNWVYTAILCAAAPNATYWVAVFTSRKKDPFWGPAITHTTVLAPIVFLLTTSVVEAQLTWAQRKMHVSRPPFTYRVVAAGFVSLAAISWCLAVYKHPVAHPKRVKNTSLSPTVSKAIIITVSIVSWALTFPFLASPILPHPLPAPYTRPNSNIKIHSAVQSVTGLILVGEALPPPEDDNAEVPELHSVRYLRASHSILGGVWMDSKVNVLEHKAPPLDSFGTPLGDSIYSAFVLQEAVRLVDGKKKKKKEKDSLPVNGLVIGLGIGTSATAFIRHDISTTIVEIDPAVYDAARVYFGLPDPGPGNLFLEDARRWVERESARVHTGEVDATYNFVVHDCFSGGGVPEHIFTLEFWDSLKTIMKPEGVVAVNIAGVPRSDATRMVLATLEKSFASCRAFHDLFMTISEEQYTEFINIVFFCTKSDSPLTFRESKSDDWLGSPMRRHVLESISERELDLNIIREYESVEDNSKFILTDAHNPLGKLQDEQGLRHWRLMRDVLPDEHWETF